MGFDQYLWCNELTQNLFMIVAVLIILKVSSILLINKDNSESSSLLKPIYNGKGSDLIWQLNANCNTITIDEDKIGSRKTRYEIHPNGFVPSTSHHQNMIHFSSIKRNTKAAMNFEKVKSFKFYILFLFKS